VAPAAYISSLWLKISGNAGIRSISSGAFGITNIVQIFDLEGPIDSWDHLPIWSEIDPEICYLQAVEDSNN